MSSYQKFTLNTIREKLKNGDYESLTGANRAIGKTQELSDADKVKAKAMAAKHFGVEPGAAKPKTKKATKKVAKAVKKVAKKAVAKKAKAAKAPKAAPAAAAAAPAKKVAKKAPAKKTAKKAAKKAAKASAKAEAPAPSPAPSAPAPRAAGPSNGDALNRAGTIISTISQALASMEVAKRLFPKAELEASVVAATQSMTRAVRILDREVIAPMLPADKESKSAPKAAKAASKNTPKKVKRTRATTAAPPPVDEPEDAEELADTEEHEHEEANGQSDMDPEQLRLLELGRESKSAAEAAAKS